MDAQWLPALLDLSDAALVGIDLDGKVAFWSRGAEHLFGWTPDEVRGRTPPIIPEALQQEWHVQLNHVLETSLPTPAAETRRLTRDGRLITVLRTASVVRNSSGQVAGLLDLLVDATTLRQHDEESRALVQVRERELIAMDLHDGLVQSLYAVVLNLAAQERAFGDEPSGAAQAIKAARHEVESVIGETRTYISDLRGRGFAPRSIESGLRLLVDGLRLNAAVDVDFRFDAGVEASLSPEVRGHLLFLAREAVSNVLRHAHARSATIALQRSGTNAVLRITDDGRGFSPGAGAQSTERHRGLQNMAERARLVGGKLEITSAPGKGTQVCLDLPLAA